MKNSLLIFSALLLILSGSLHDPRDAAAATPNRLAGRILLQVEKNGEAWYVNPKNLKRYFLGRPDDAFRIMRDLGLGISNRDLARIGKSDEIAGDPAFARRLAGTIVLQVEDQGQAWYINPNDLKRYFLGRPNDAFRVMRELGLGAKNADIEAISPSAVSRLESSTLKADAPLQDRIAALEGAVKMLEGHIATLNSEINGLKGQEGGLLEGSREEVLPKIVEAASKAVVSVVVSKDVPLLERVLVNPFENDPRLKGVDVRVPVFQKKGVERKKVGAGTGFFATPDGYIVTNKHVVADTQASYTALLSDGTQKPAKVFYRDADHDIAIIKIADGGYPVIPLSNSDNLRLGESVIAIGNALGEFGNTISVGIVSGLKRTINAKDTDGAVTKLENVIQTDAAINPGNSGGPLLDFAGRAVGVNVATVIGSENIGFALPINELREILSTALKR
ncbi:trypsin-like peptidase domain-containing protein [Candidatus Uhrbacteria bacterium]|nr:trypsin-like peptidase domain-containing protein [Candidatus Uhrbacteria bacterium]